MALFVGTAPDVLMRVMLVICALLHVGTGVGLGVLGKRIGGPIGGALAFLLWTLNPVLMVWAWGLKENVLYALLLTLALLTLERVLRRGPSRSRLIQMGLFCGLMIFTRVKAVISVAVVLAVLFLTLPADRESPHSSFSQRIRAVLGSAAVALLTCGPWYLFAWAWFGSALPTSGVSKFIVSRVQVQTEW